MLSELQKRKLIILFHMLDINKDGAMSQEDFELVSRNFAILRGWQPGSSEYDYLLEEFMSMWTVYFCTADRSFESKVSIHDFLEGFERQFASQHGHSSPIIKLMVDTTFDLVDADGDGLLSLAEHSQYFQAYGFDLNVASVSFEHLDRDRDGYISKSEFCQAINEFFGNDPNAPGNWFFGAYEID
jgi:juvenile hormone diol kinase